MPIVRFTPSFLRLMDISAVSSPRKNSSDILVAFFLHPSRLLPVCLLIHHSRWYIDEQESRECIPTVVTRRLGRWLRCQTSLFERLAYECSSRRAALRGEATGFSANCGEFHKSVPQP